MTAHGLPCAELRAETFHRRSRALRRLAAVLAAVLVAAPVAVAEATVTPASGGARAAFEVTFPMQGVALGLQLEGPGRCADLDPMEISIRQAQTGRFRFGPGVPGARPRREDKRVRRWCHGAYRVSVIASEEFDPTAATTIASGRFSVR